MKIYLVGGAVRDQLLGLPVKEKDWVVVGSTPNEMRKNKFKQVGKDFPVFIHPKTGEEYALARTERKSGHGYTGFEFDTNPNVTLEEDLERRDLTINAIAQDEDGTLIDPFNGQEDIKNKKLRHVSDAFSEDPLRVLRIARFKANLQNFEVDPKTMDKVREVINSGELEYLTGERIWLELYKSNHPVIFAQNLDDMNISGILPGYDPAGLGDVLLLLQDRENFKNKTQSIAVFIAYMIRKIDEFCEKLKVPNEYKDLAKMLLQCDYATILHKLCLAMPAPAAEYVAFIKMLDVRKEERLKNFFEIIPLEKEDKDFLISMINKIKGFKLKEKDQKKSNQEIQEIIKSAYQSIAKEHLKEYLNNKK